jgi:hypothetical protein
MLAGSVEEDIHVFVLNMHHVVWTARPIYALARGSMLKMLL